MRKALFCSVTLLAMVGSAASSDPRLANFWPLKPVVRPEPPTAVSTGSNPIDAFIAAKLSARGLRAAGPADKPTLLRRVYLDLIGIPPTPEEQEAFLQDQSPDAY